MEILLPLLLIFLQWVIFLYFMSNFPGWIWAANCFLCSSSSLFSVFSFLSPLFLSLSSWAILSLFHAWMVQGSIKQNLGIPLSGHFYHRIWPLTSAFIVFWLYFSNYTYQKDCEFSHMHSCHHHAYHMVSLSPRLKTAELETCINPWRPSSNKHELLTRIFLPLFSSVCSDSLFL